MSGDGVLETDSVCVIGSSEQTKEFRLTLRTDENIAEEWDYNKRNWEALVPHGEGTPEQRLRKHIFEQLDDKPPTATLFPMEEDRELGIDGGWWMEVNLPANVLSQLQDDLMASRTSKIELGIKWVAGLVFDQHAPGQYLGRFGALVRARRRVRRWA
jgi:hypothetical protein